MTILSLELKVDQSQRLVAWVASKSHLEAAVATAA